MKKIIFDVPAANGGALKILEEYHQLAISDKDNEWIFVLSDPLLEERPNIKVLRYLWVKKSWFHRLFFDFFVAPKIVEKNKVDELISLQNILIPKVKIRQTLYLHQSLPFVKQKYDIWNNTKLWIYQNLISLLIFWSIKKSDKVIVQTKWMMKAAIKKTNELPNKFEVKPPMLTHEIKNRYASPNNNFSLFFYPANAMAYKNHKIIIEALKKIPEKFLTQTEFIFTITGNENKQIIELYNTVKNHSLPVSFVGTLSTSEVYDYYSKSTLIFPSLVETFGLPLLEAKKHGCPIIASDTAFSHEILFDYNDAKFFDPKDSDQLSIYLRTQIQSNQKVK